MNSHPACLTRYCGFNLLKRLVTCSSCCFFNARAVTKYSCINLLCTNQASPLLSSISLLPCFFVTSCLCPPFSESQAPWLFQSQTPLKLLLGSTTPDGLTGSCRSRREPLCFCTSEPLMTGGREGTTEWLDLCHTSTLLSKTCKMCSSPLVLIHFLAP